MSGFGDLTNVTVEKLQELETVLQAILALPIAKDTYAQIIDGMPTRTPYSDEYRRDREAGSTLYSTIIESDNTKPSDEAVQEYEKIKAAFAPQHLIIDLEVRTHSIFIFRAVHFGMGENNLRQLAQRYQNAPAGSNEHSLRLLQITAASLNAFAGKIYGSRHPDMEVFPIEPAENSLAVYLNTDDFYVKFYHTHYRLFQKYPFGLLNVVGYWAEAEIFGGVLLFEREEDSGVRSISMMSQTYADRYQISNAFLHPQKSTQAFQLSDTQLEHFAQLRQAHDVAKGVSAETLLPFTKEPNARVEPTNVEMGQPPLRIFKNEYDKPRPMLPLPKRKCVIRGGDKNDPRAAKMEEVVAAIKRHDRGEASDQEALKVTQVSASFPEENPTSTDEEDV